MFNYIAFAFSDHAIIINYFSILSPALQLHMLHIFSVYHQPFDQDLTIIIGFDESLLLLYFLGRACKSSSL